MDVVKSEPSIDRQALPKHVSFELLLNEGPQHRARLPMRVNIFPHDATESIITTVKNFYGLYEGKGVSFEDSRGNTLIAQYENLENNMVVYVRVVHEEVDAHEAYSQASRPSVSPTKPYLAEPIQMLPPQLHGSNLSRPSSRTARKRSVSPHSHRGRRSTSVSTNPKSRARPGMKSRGTSSQGGSFNELNGDIAGYSDSDGGNASVTSSRRSKMEQVASAEISVDNIVEGGRRKRAKFDSSELPLFVPPQVPMTASISSISPQRRIGSQNGASPFSYSNQRNFVYNHHLPSPQSFSHGEYSYPQTGQPGIPYSMPTPRPGQRPRTRTNNHYMQSRHSISGISGLLPTPDPTIGSVISDEDAAIQLMRLGDASNFSSHGRTSTSTLDDALSGKAEVASSEDESGEGSEDESMLPSYPEHMGGTRSHITGEGHQQYDSGESSENDYEDRRDGSFKGGSDEIMSDPLNPSENKTCKPKPNGAILPKARSAGSISKASNKKGKSRTSSISKSKPKNSSATKAPISPTSLPTASRKPSNASLNFQNQLGVDEEDLSTKPRCQRCRKSKKGCDRQRPCGRCKDAGIGIEGCISEDEGNGRKGRFGRHMGVPVKKGEDDVPIAESHATQVGHMLAPLAPADKSKKRKR
ncbi:hypothetical protein M501DRAFT_936398 [Patellaria atrata CBS 101060]|uniref:Zn(2)-C6 fungal-type domain-containing protein n=1 Tax=Patellaria atrata CBS 101060 TaxID=1346257 RepID=A0A9P4S9C1_9PEZI|nr:hypothetical protein M501DRAFT_936398 [Patellaria atrata CBS 101060]